VGHHQTITQEHEKYTETPINIIVIKQHQYKFDVILTVHRR